MRLSPQVPPVDAAEQERDLFFPAEVCSADVDLVCHRCTCLKLPWPWRHAEYGIQAAG